MRLQYASEGIPGIRRHCPECGRIYDAGGGKRFCCVVCGQSIVKRLIAAFREKHPDDMEARSRYRKTLLPTPIYYGAWVSAEMRKRKIDADDEAAACRICAEVDDGIR